MDHNISPVTLRSTVEVKDQNPTERCILLCYRQTKDLTQLEKRSHMIVDNMMVAAKVHPREALIDYRQLVDDEDDDDVGNKLNMIHLYFTIS